MWLDDCRRKPRPGQPAQPERGHILGAARPGDVVLVASLGVLATTDADALRLAAAIAEAGAVLREARTGRTYRVRPEAAPDVADALRLAADIKEDERRLVMERARSHIKVRPTGATPVMDQAAKDWAAVYWYDQSLTTEQAAAKAGYHQRTLYRALGKRNRPAFGKALTKRRTKRDAD